MKIPSSKKLKIEASLVAEMKTAVGVKSRTKRTAVRLAISNTIRNGVMLPGDSLPSEKELALILSVSLGTVQAALGQLQDKNTIVRRRGDGTRVANIEPIADSIWHFRFVTKTDQTPMRVAHEDLRIETTTETGPWTDHLGSCTKYIRIWRCLKMRDGTITGAEMYLSYDIAHQLQEVEFAELQMSNIRHYLEEKLGLVAHKAKHLVGIVDADNETVNRFKLVRSELCYEIQATTWSPEGKPVYFQRILVPTAACMLDF